MFCKQNHSNSDCSFTHNRKLNNDERTGVSMHRYAVKKGYIILHLHNTQS